MLIFVPKEANPEETRIPLLPDTVAKLAKKGAEFTVEQGLGASCGIADEAYEKAGAKISKARAGMLGKADMVLRLGPPPIKEVAKMKKGCIHISYLDPFFEPKLVDELVKCGISAIAQLQQESLPANIELIDGGCGGLTLLPLFEDCQRLIIIDAADFGASAGSIRTLRNPDLNQLPAALPHQASHNFGLIDILRAAEKLGSLPALTLVLLQQEFNMLCCSTH